MTIKTQPKTAFGKTLHYVTDPVQAAALTDSQVRRLSMRQTLRHLRH